MASCARIAKKPALYVRKRALFLRPETSCYRTLHYSSPCSRQSEASTDQKPPIPWMTHRLSKEQIAKVDGIFHKILWLDIFESAMLNELINERLDLKMTKKQRKQLENRMAALERDGEVLSEQPKKEQEAGPALFDVKLAGFDAKSKIKVIKEVRGLINGLGLKEAKEMVEGAPVTICKGMVQEAADELKAKLEAAGAQIELLPL